MEIENLVSKMMAKIENLVSKMKSTHTWTVK
jgi:hypothetical protein